MSQLSTAMHSRGKLLTAAVVSEGNSADGARLQIWDCFAGANQRWTLP